MIPFFVGWKKDASSMNLKTCIPPFQSDYPRTGLATVVNILNPYYPGSSKPLRFVAPVPNLQAERGTNGQINKAPVFIELNRYFYRSHNPFSFSRRGWPHMFA